jgi:hypothetical protein
MYRLRLTPAPNTTRPGEGEEEEAPMILQDPGILLATPGVPAADVPTALPLVALPEEEEEGLKVQLLVAAAKALISRQQTGELPGGAGPPAAKSAVLKGLGS